MKKGIFFILTFVVIFSGSAVFANERVADYSRPGFDKTDYLKTAWSQANPWFPPNLSRTHHVPGGPDYSWWNLSNDARIMWKQVAEKMSPYGLTGLQMEIHIFDDGRPGWHNVFETMLEGFSDADVDFYGIPFFGRPAPDVELTLKGLEALMPLITEHPNIYRVDGAPVVVFYIPTRLTPEQWIDVIETIESRHGRMIWLFNTWVGDLRAAPELVQDYLRVFDGITQYANWGSGLDHFRMLDDVREEFPEKIWELSVHHTYFVHFHYGGVDPVLTSKFRREWGDIFGFNPDAISITNFFDKYENSRIFPSYESEDILMMLSGYHLSDWRGQPFVSPDIQEDIPDLYVSNQVSVLLGQPMHFEVIGFPSEQNNGTANVHLELCGADGRVLHFFESREFTFNSMQVEEYSVPSVMFFDQRAVLPRLRYEWGGSERVSYLFPQTNIVTSIRPHLLYWTRSLKRMPEMVGDADWSISGKGPGETLEYPATGMGIITSRIAPSCWAEAPVANNQRTVPRHGEHGLARIMRNSIEIESWGKDWFAFGYSLDFTKISRMPNPGGTLDWYNLELENPYGRYGARYTTPPVWVVSGERGGEVNLPVMIDNVDVAEFRVEAVRVPFFHYDCKQDAGPLLLDVSGHDHHGYLGGAGFGGGHLGYTGYRHEHFPRTGTRPLPQDVTDHTVPRFRTDEEGEGYLHFNGESYVMIMGGTAFPYASTYEMYIHPDITGERMGIMGAPNGSISVFITEEGSVEVNRDGTKNGQRASIKVISEDTVRPGNWAHIAIIYDLRQVRLYINGRYNGSAQIGPDSRHERINPVVLGGTAGFPYTPRPAFKGGIRDVRFYGRNLDPAEFLFKVEE